LSSFSEIPEVSASPLLHTQRERIRVLVAEPDIASRRLISSLLACESEITANYIDGSRLVSSVRESFPDLVILDAPLPGKCACDPAGRRLERFGDSGTSCNDRYSLRLCRADPVCRFCN